MPNTPFSIFHPEAKGRSGGSIGGGVSSVNDVSWNVLLFYFHPLADFRFRRTGMPLH
jgi:hypothetical protein